jgi:hypothetical protein
MIWMLIQFAIIGAVSYPLMVTLDPPSPPLPAFLLGAVSAFLVTLVWCKSADLIARRRRAGQDRKGEPLRSLTAGVHVGNGPKPIRLIWVGKNVSKLT